MNLWQRCEALGPMEDQGVSLYRTDSGDYRIFIDRATVFHVHQDGTIGDYCREWLAEAILQRFEAITKQGGTVLTTSNVVKEVERMYNETVHSFSGGPKEWRERFMADETDGRHNEPNWEGCPPGSVPVAIPQPTEPTYEQRKRLYELLYASNGMGNTEFEVSVDSIPKVFLRRKSDGRSMCAISPAKYDYAFINGGISFETACATVGMNIENPTQPTEDQCKQLYDYVLSGKADGKGFAIKMHNRFAKEPEITVEWPVHPRRGFSIKPKSFYGYHDINGGRQLTFSEACEWVGMTADLPTPERLPEPTYIVEAPKEFVSIPVGEYFDARASIEQVKEAFGKLSEAFAAISKMYTPEP